MITRIVRMKFIPDEVNAFQEVFTDASPRIRKFEGCLKLELARDTSDENVFYTVSEWESEDALNKYRESELFEQTWIEAKKRFADKPFAFSLENIVRL